MSDAELKQVEGVDDTLLHYEFEELMEFTLFDTPPYKAMEQDFSQRGFTGVEQEFVSAFKRLTVEQKGLCRHRRLQGEVGSRLHN